jgi:putative phosphoribosyl transferase
LKAKLPDWSIGRNVFDIELLARRLLMTTAWIRQNAQTRDLLVGYFGAITDAAAALVAGS